MEKEWRERERERERELFIKCVEKEDYGEKVI